MAKIIHVLRGLPASGKSTLATEMLFNNDNFVRVNKDDLRRLIHRGLPWSGKREGIVVNTETELLNYFMSIGKEIIIDNTNLNPSHLDRYKSLANVYGYEIDIIDMEVSIEECIRRDSLRTDSVGRDVILNMAFQYGLAKQEKQFAIYDMDGTLANCNIRREMANLDGKRIDWQIFLDPKTVILDTPRREIVDSLINDKQSGLDIYIVSGRPENMREATEKWLGYYNIPYDRLIMRSNGDSRKDYIVKKEILDRYLDKTFCVKVVDDRPSVIAMWKEQGLEVIDVGNGEDF